MRGQRGGRLSLEATGAGKIYIYIYIYIYIPDDHPMSHDLLIHVSPILTCQSNSGLNLRADDECPNMVR